MLVFLIFYMRQKLILLWMLVVVSLELNVYFYVLCSHKMTMFSKEEEAIPIINHTLYLP